MSQEWVKARDRGCGPVCIIMADPSGDLAATVPMPQSIGEEDEEVEESQNKLSFHDSYRFGAVVEEAVDKLDLLSALITEAGRRREMNKNQEGEGGEVDGGKNNKDVYHLMVNQKELEEKYEMLMDQRSKLRGLSNRKKYMQNKAELKEVEDALRTSTSTITQSLNDQPTSSNTLKIQKDTDELADLLRETGAELKTQSFEALIQQVTARIIEQRRLWETQLAHEKTREALKNLNLELREERERFGRVVEEKNTNISKLTSELKQLKKVTMLSLKYEKETALAQRDTLERMRKRRLDNLKNQIVEIQEKLEQDNKVNDLTTKFLNKRRDELGDLQSQWQQKYDTDVSKLKGDLDGTQKERDDKLAILNRFRARWEVDKAERHANDMEKKQRKVEEENKKELMKVMNLAQSSIHFFWRVYNRKRPKKKGKKKKGSKKKAVKVK